MTKEITLHINNLAYTIEADEELEAELGKYLDFNQNNETKVLLFAYLRLTQEYRNLKKDVEDITNKLAGI